MIRGEASDGFFLHQPNIGWIEMTRAVPDRFRELTIWKKAGQRAPHKPLMLLIALGNLQNGVRQFSYEQVEQQLTDLLVKYARPPRKGPYKPEEPFWRLGRKEKIFALTNEEKCRVHADGGTNKSDLIGNSVSASFDDEILNYFGARPEAIPEVAAEIIYSHFQPSFIEDLFDEVGLSFGIEQLKKRPRRDPEFRRRILRAYEDKCAVCEFHMVVSQRAIGVEAAHIMWHNAGGPDIESNGLALCTLHHKLFDYGVFLIEPVSFTIKISDSVSCFNAAENYVREFHNKPITLPGNKDFIPDETYLKWHKKEIFKGVPKS